jgi:hypothetical protein
MTPERLHQLEMEVGSQPYSVVLELIDHIRQRDKWIADLQSGMFINCVYCGHRYGRADQLPASKAEVLKQHIAKCPEHPMSALLEACKKALPILQSYNATLSICDEVESAIAKAEGGQ